MTKGKMGKGEMAKIGGEMAKGEVGKGEMGINPYTHADNQFKHRLVAQAGLQRYIQVTSYDECQAFFH
jgi:hypothetical protein